ncbi:fibronectin type III domain-containing protein [Vallitalea guaymasensis]|uniref:Fibronectin type-III domain-containing protein n=1 Tax=Vallitalea guaymasensis TaxID=1185412 RepID=A0A8J8MBG4_9FIRM|nr:fibronectin type III domain-containing protein [Vallitalea guaymasensis]QUH29779.1 hypothetical protein HYG85_13030 [Vallitalea guaymasensis]
MKKIVKIIKSTLMYLLIFCYLFSSDVYLANGDILAEETSQSLVELLIDSTEYILEIGEEHDTIVTAVFSDTSKREVTLESLFTTTNNEIVSVEDDGTVIANGTGEATIVVTYDGLSVEITVSVIELQVQTIKIPTNVDVTTDESTISLHWDPVTNAESYDVQIDDVLISNIIETQYIQGDLIPDKQYSVKIRAVNKNVSSEWSEVVTVTTTVINQTPDIVKDDTETLIANEIDNIEMKNIPDVTVQSSLPDPIEGKIIIDGNIGDWNNIGEIATGDGNLSTMKAAQDSNKLYVMVEGSDMDTSDVVSFYIDSDNDGATGFQSGEWSDCGAEYLIEGDILYQYAGTGSDWNWTQVKGIEKATTTMVVEIAVPLADIGLAEAAEIKIGCIVQAGSNNYYAPIENNTMAIANTIITGQAPLPDPIEGKITIDGNIGDWNNIGEIATGDGNLSTMKAAQDSNKLYVMVEGSNMDTSDVVSFYIDSDNDGATGLQSGEWSDCGAEYLIEGDILYQYAGTGSDWNWTQVKGIEKTTTTTVVEIAVPLADIGLAEAAEIKIGCIVQAGSNNYYAPLENNAMAIANTIITGQAPLPDPIEGKIIIDGNIGDWNNIGEIATGDGNLSSMKAAQDSNKLYVMVEGSNMDTSDVVSFYIDSDNDGATGLQSGEWSDCGAEYLIEGDILYQYAGTGSDWNWTQVKGIEKTTTTTVVEIAVPLADIGLAEAAEIKIGCIVQAGSNNYYAPLENNAMAIANTIITGQAPLPDPIEGKIIIDGNIGDWNNIGEIATGDGNLSSMKAAQDSNKLYVMVEGSNMDTSDVVSFYIDSDNDGATGLQSGEWSDCGAEYLIEGDILYQYAGTGSDWNWTQVKGIEKTTTTTVVEIAVPLADIGLAEAAEIKIGCIVQAGSNNYYAPLENNAMAIANTIITGQASLPDPIEGKIIIDGNIGDWNNIGEIATGDGNLSSMKAAQDSNKLYVMVEGSNMDTSDVVSFYIDSDNDGATGLQSGEWSDCGAEYLIEGDILYQYAGTGSDWNWTQVKGIEKITTTTVVEIAVPLADIGLAEAAEIKIGCIVQAGSNNYYAPIHNNTMAIANQVLIPSVSVFNLILTASNIDNFSETVFRIEYDSNKLTLNDLCTMTELKETTVGDINQTEITVTQCQPGLITFTIDKTLLSNEKWSGIVNSILFNEISSDGKTTINYTVQSE